MACTAVHTGSAFLSGTLSHLDCQARTVGAYGYGALADPGSSVALALTGLLTIFIALFGLRLILGEPFEGRDLVGSVIRIGLFLTLATSWPAWRAVGYDLILDGPAQIASSIGLASGLPGSSNDIAARLQDADDGIVTLTMYGSGRLTGGVAAGADLGDAASGIAMADQTAFASGRTTFLVTVIGAWGLLHLGAGILLALAPLMAGLMLFTGTMGLFVGWLRGLAFCALGSVLFTVFAGATLSLLYPWLGDALAQRQANVFVPSAPTELFVLSLAFAVMTAGGLFLIARITFLPALTLTALRFWTRGQASGDGRGQGRTALLAASAQADRVAVISGAVSPALQRERTSLIRPGTAGADGAAAQGSASTAAAQARAGGAPIERLGTNYRRTAPRHSAAGRRRDQA